MTMFFRMVYSLPTWLVTKLFLLKLPNHPWHSRDMSLRAWTTHETSLARQFNFVLWVDIGLVILVIVYKCLT